MFGWNKGFKNRKRFRRRSFYWRYRWRIFPWSFAQIPCAPQFPMGPYIPVYNSNAVLSSLEQTKSIYETEKVDEKTLELTRKIYSLLPKRNCGACGYNSCYDLALAIASGKERPNACRIAGNIIEPEIKRILKEEK